MYHMNKKMEIRNVDVSKQAFCGKGGYTTPVKYCEGGYIEEGLFLHVVNSYIALRLFVFLFNSLIFYHY